MGVHEFVGFVLAAVLGHVCLSLAQELTVLRDTPQPVRDFPSVGNLKGRRLQGLDEILSRYYSNEELESYLKTYVLRCARIARLVSMGVSGEGRELWALELSVHAGQQEAQPHFKWVANVHGDEPSGRQLTLALAEWLCEHYDSDPTARHLLHNIHLWLIPSLNPDGFAAKKRENSGNKDLNRNFPDPIFQPAMVPTGREQPETLALMNFTLSHPFVASASFHEGALVANYPWDGTADGSTQYNATDADATFVFLATSFAKMHTTMHQSKEFQAGVTNGAAWYPISGGMQDWNYIVAGCWELTLELNQNKWPPAAQLPQLWEQNRQALMHYPLLATLGGVRGTVREHTTGQPLLAASIVVEGAGRTVRARAPFGDFYRPLPPGRYNLSASAEGYASKSVEVIVPADGSGVSHNFHLESEAIHQQLHTESTVQRWVLRKSLAGPATKPRAAGEGGTTFSSSWTAFLAAQLIVLGLVLAQVFVLLQWRCGKRRRPPPPTAAAVPAV